MPVELISILLCFSEIICIIVLLYFWSSVIAHCTKTCYPPRFFSKLLLEYRRQPRVLRTDVRIAADTKFARTNFGSVMLSYWCECYDSFSLLFLEVCTSTHCVRLFYIVSF